MKGYTDYYCDYCEAALTEDDIYVDKNDNIRCKKCDSIIEEGADICYLCGKKICKGDGHWVCEECMKKLANPTDAIKIINEDYESEELTDNFLSFFYTKDAIRKFAIEKIKEEYEREVKDQKMWGRKSFNHIVEDHIINFYKSHEHLFTDDDGEFATQLLEDK